MKKVLLIAALTLMSSPALAQSNSATATGSTTIIEPVSVTLVDNLIFGILIRPETGNGTATIGTDSEVSTTGGVVAVGDSQKAASFSVSGESGYSFSITAPETFIMNNGANNLTVTLIQSDTTATLVDGSATFTIGGVVPLTSTTPSGTYSGTFLVTVSYN